MKIWVDDLRTAPDGWTWVKTSIEAIALLNACQWFSQNGRTDRHPEIISLDHDLGDDDTTRPIVIWMIENDFWPVEISIHTSNPVGREWLQGMIDRYKP